MSKEIELIQDPILKQSGVVTPIGLNLPDNINADQWKQVGLELARFETAGQWWLGDWWAFGEHKWGDRKKLVESEEWTGPVFQACAHAATVSRRFEQSRRRSLLSFTHHLEVASLDQVEADSLLDWCETPLKNGRKKPKSIRELHEEMARRDNVQLEESAIAAIEQFLSEYGDLDPKKFEQARQVGIAAIKAEIAKQNQNKTVPTVVKLSRIMTEAIEEFLGPVRGDLHAYMNFIGPVRNLAEQEVADFDLLAMAQSESLLQKDIDRCDEAIAKIRKFVSAVKKRFKL